MDLPTGNVWNDPDTFGLPASQRKAANPDNVLAGAATGMKTTVWNDPDTFGKPASERRSAGAGASAVAVAEKELIAEDAEAVLAMKAQISRVAKDAKAGVAEAQQLLADLAKAEYGRADGGRLAIKRALAAAGVKKP